MILTQPFSACAQNAPDHSNDTASVSAPEEQQELAITDLTIPELEVRMADLEAKGRDEEFSGLNDKEFDQLMAYQDQLLKLVTARTEESTKRAEESCRIVLALGGSCAEQTGK